MDEENELGSFTVHWDGRDSTGTDVPSRLYLYQIKAGRGDFVTTRKMLLLR